MMKKIMTLILCVGILAGLTACGGNESATAYLGDWNIAGLVENAPMGDMADGDLDTILSSRLSFSKESASCFGDSMDTLGTSVENPEYISQDIPKEVFEQMTGVTFEQLGRTGDSISQVAVVQDPERNTGIVFYVVNKDTLLANSVGTFFQLTRAE